MRTCLLVPFVLAFAAPRAFAMGPDVSLDLVAWSSDGTSALLRRHTSMDRDTTDSYVLVAVGDKQAQSFDVSHANADGGHQQLLDNAACAKNLSSLRRALSAHKFGAAVTVRADRCDRAQRDDAVHAAASAADVAASWVAMAMGRSETPREKVSWELVKKVVPKFKLTFPHDPGDDAIDVANKRGSLILVFYTPGAGAPVRTKVFAFASTATGSDQFLTVD